MATELTRVLNLLRYSVIKPSVFNDIDLSEEIGQSISPDTIVRWDNGDSPVAFPATIKIGDKLRITNSTVSTNGLYTIASITTTTVTNDTITVTPDNGTDTIGNGTRTGGGVGNMIIFREANTSLGSTGLRFEELYAKKLDVSTQFVLADGSETATDAAPTTDEGVVNKKYVDDQISANSGIKNIVFEELSSPISSGTPHTLPGSATYFGDAPSTGATVTFGRWLTIRLNGQKLYAGDTGFERDYKETGTNATGQTQVTFEFDLKTSDRLEYVILKE